MQATIDTPEKPTLAQHATSSHQYWNCVRVAAEYVKATVGSAEMAIVLGSGLMDFVDRFEQNPPPKSIEYSKVPYMPGTNVPGHSGKIYVGQLATKGGVLRSVMCFAGRVHAYEGWSATEFNFIVRLAHACGVKVLLLTNSAGGALKDMSEGSIMLITDHLRFSGINPLADVSDDPRFGPRHTDAATAYSPRIRDLARAAAKKLQMPLLEGTYCWTSGPSYETPAEVQAGMLLSVNSLGGAFGMSTVPEILAAHALGMEVCAVSLCTNLAAGLGNKELTHGDVKEVAEIAGPRFQSLLVELFASLDVDAERSNSVLPVSFDAVSAHTPLSALGTAPSKSLYALGGWTPSKQQVAQATVQVGTVLNAGSYNALAAAVVFFGGRGQQELARLFLSQLREVRSVPIREVLPSWAHNVGLLSSYSATGVLLVGSLPSDVAPAAAAAGASAASAYSHSWGHGKRVAVLMSADGNGVVGPSSGEVALLMQVFAHLGANSLLLSAVGVDTVERTIGGLPHDKHAAKHPAPKLMLLEDVLDRTSDPLPLLLPRDADFLRTVPESKAPLFDVSLTHAIERALLPGSGKKGVAPTVGAGSFLSFQGPMLPTEAELNIAFHAGSVSTAGVSALGQWVAAAAEVGMKAAALVHSVPHAQDIPAPAVSDKHALADAEHLASTVSIALINALTDAKSGVEHVARNLRLVQAHAVVAADIAATSLAGNKSSTTFSSPAERDSAGYGPVSLVYEHSSFEAVSAATSWLREQMAKAGLPQENAAAGVAALKSFVFAEGMLASVFAAGSSSAAAAGAAGVDVAASSAADALQVLWDVSALDVPHFAESLGIGLKHEQLTGSLGRSGAAYPYDPRVLLSSWRLQLVRFGASAAAPAILLLVNTHDRAGHAPAFHGLNFFVRVAKLLQSASVVSNILLLAPVASCSAELAPGSLVLLTDHINMTGLNPLFGENDARWGPRFNDMSVVYRPAGRAAFTTQPAGAALPTSILAQVSNPGLSSLSEANLARSVRASTLVSGLAPISTLAKHADVAVTALGYVFRSAGASDDASAIRNAGAQVTAAIAHAVTLPTQSTIQTLRGLVSNALQGLHDNGVVAAAAAVAQA